MFQQCTDHLIVSVLGRQVERRRLGRPKRLVDEIGDGLRTVVVFYCLGEIGIYKRVYPIFEAAHAQVRISINYLI